MEILVAIASPVTLEIVARVGVPWIPTPTIIHISATNVTAAEILSLVLGTVFPRANAMHPDMVLYVNIHATTAVIVASMIKERLLVRPRIGLGVLANKGGVVSLVNKR